MFAGERCANGGVRVPSEELRPWSRRGSRAAASSRSLEDEDIDGTKAAGMDWDDELRENEMLAPWWRSLRRMTGLGDDGKRLFGMATADEEGGALGGRRGGGTGGFSAEFSLRAVPCDFKVGCGAGWAAGLTARLLSER